MPGWDALLGVGSTAEQFFIWQVAGQVVSDLLGPTFALISQDVNSGHPVITLTPADLADAVVRGIKSHADAATEAAKSGIDGSRFSELVLGAGEPPGLETVMEMYRRKLIPLADAGPGTVSVERAIKTGRIYDEWTQALVDNAQVPISVGEAVDAYIRGQVDLATAQAEAEANGVNPERFTILTDTAGRPPSLTELLELKRRRLIPDKGLGPDVRSFQQGIAEGDTKNKWLNEYLALALYVPPPRTVVALLKTGAIDEAQALAWFMDAGMDTPTAAKYVSSAKGEKLAGSRQLAEGTVTTLYESQAIDEATATAHLTALGYDAADAALVLALADLKRVTSAVNSAVTKTGNLYIRRKITRAGAADALAALDITKGHADQLLTTWDTERTETVAQLTAAQITTAMEYGVIDQATAEAELQDIGYTAWSAWVLLSNKAKGPLPGEPARASTGPQVIG